MHRAMHARRLWAPVVFALSAFAARASAADDPKKAEDPKTADDVRLEVALDVGYTYMSARGSISEPSASSGVGPGSTTPSGTGNFTDSGFALGGRFSVVAPYYGPGVPRALLLAGITGFFGRDQSSTFAALHGGNNDSGVELSRKYVIDIAVGVVFPLCGQWSCMDLKAFLGAGIVGQTVTGTTNEGAGNVQSSSSTIRTGPLLGVIVSKPLCSDCTEHALRIELGTIARSILAGGVDFTAPSGNAYSSAVSGLEFEFFAGLSLPL
jgi:hypothetical protein